MVAKKLLRELPEVTAGARWAEASSCRAGQRSGPLARVNLKIQVDLGTVVKLTNRFGLTLVAVVLAIDLIIHCSRERGEAIRAVRSNDVGFHGAGPRIGEVDHSVGNRGVL